MQPIPSKGMRYHFFDDGKLNSSRHFIATVIDIIPIHQARSIIIRSNKTLYSIWRKESININWLYSKKTDVIIKCNIDKYDNDPIYFARTKSGDWFSFNTTNSWQAGRLDVDGLLFKKYISIKLLN